MNNEAFREKFKVEPDSFESIKAYKAYLTEKVMQYREYYKNATIDDVKEYMNYLAAAIFLKSKDYYPNVSIYEPFRTKSNMSFNRNLNKETTNQFVENDDLLFDDDRIIGDINAITIVLDHINNTVALNPNYDYTDNPQIVELLEESDNLSLFVKDTENNIDGILTREEYLNYKREVLNKIIQVNFSEFTEERTPSYQSELSEVEKAISNLSSSASYASETEVETLKNLIKDLKSKLYDKAYYTLMPELFETVINDPLIVEGLRVKAEFVKDVRKANGFAANYYLLRTPFGNIEVQLQSAKRYYEAKKGSAAHNSIPGKQLDVKNLFELADPNDRNPLDYYLNYLDKTSSAKMIYEPYFGDKHSYQYKEAEKINEFLKHIKLKDYYSEDPNEQPIRIDKFIYTHALNSSPYMGICRSAHTNFRNVDIIHRSRVSAYSDILRKIDTLSCLGDIIINRLHDYMENPENGIIEKDTDKVQEIGLQAINKYISKLSKNLESQDNPKKDDDDLVK